MPAITINTILMMLLELLIVLGLLFLADRWLHQSLQGLMLLLANDREISMWLYAILLLPGVALHEFSHALFAYILGVPFGRINILPRRVGKHLQLGYVPVAQTDIVRDSLIGAAPLLLGGTVVVLMGNNVFGTPAVVAALSNGDWLLTVLNLAEAFKKPDIWIWVYLIFAISNTMLPSPSDTHAWPMLATLLGGLIILIVAAGGGTWLLAGLGNFLTMVLRWIVLLGGCTLLIDLPFLLIISLTVKVLERLRGVRLQYR